MFFFFFKQKTAYEIMPSLVGSEMCIRDRCVDEKSQIQALDRTAPILPLRPGLPESRTHDYVRHGTTTLFAALEVATGQVTDACYDRHRHEEFLKFLKQVAKAYPRVKLHVVADNYATHKL